MGVKVEGGGEKIGPIGLTTWAFKLEIFVFKFNISCNKAKFSNICALMMFLAYLNSWVLSSFEVAVVDEATLVVFSFGVPHSKATFKLCSMNLSWLQVSQRSSTLQ